MYQMEIQQRGGTAGRLALVVAPPRHRRPRGRSVQMHTGENTCMHQTLHGNADQSNGRLSKQASERRHLVTKGRRLASLMEMRASLASLANVKHL